MVKTGDTAFANKITGDTARECYFTLDNTNGYEIGDGKRSTTPVTFLDQLLDPNYKTHSKFAKYRRRPPASTPRPGSAGQARATR